MKKAIKWVVIVVCVVVVLVIIALLAIPVFVDLQSYKPRIEKLVSDATGRPFSIGGDIDLSLFPWVGFASSDIRIGNPPGFQENDFANIKGIEVRVKLLPLISRDVQVKRFLLEGPRIVLERNKDGAENWEGIGRPAGKTSQPAPQGKGTEGEAEGGLPITGLAVAEFAIKNGAILWIDQEKGERREISQMTLILQDVSFERPIQLNFSAQFDGQPFDMKGKIGPLGTDPGKGTLPIEVQVKALKELIMDVKGKIVDPATTPQFDMAIQISPLSPRSLMKTLGQEFPVKTADPAALNKMALKVSVKGDPKKVSLSGGLLELDDSKLKFSAKVSEFTKPALAFNLDLDQIDLDRYMPPPSEEKPDDTSGKAEKTKKTQKNEKKKTDYSPLRKLVLDGTVKIGKLKAKGAQIQDLSMKISGKNGLFRLDPLKLNLYEGKVSSTGAFDVRQDTPKTNLALQAAGIQVNPLVQDVLDKDIIAGALEAKVNISMAGDDPDKIKGTLNGNGDLLFADGAIVGIDLADMVRNVTASFGLSEKVTEKPRTDFSELHCPFTLTNGVFNTSKTSLASPLIRLLAAGKANLVNESIDFRVEPKFVATIKGQGDTKDRGGITVPVLVTGTFSSPKFAPDLAGMLKQNLEGGIPDASELQKMLPGQSGKEGASKSTEDTVKDLLKGFGR
jgi:AsmA protein